MNLKQVLCIIIILAAFGCQEKKTEESIVLPPISALSMETSWGVVNINYLRMRDGATKQSPVITGLTKGMIVEIVTMSGNPETIEDETAYWYNVSMEGLRGWVFGAYLKIFNSRKKAEAFVSENR